MSSNDKPIKVADPAADRNPIPPRATATKTVTRGRDTGSALRSIYQQTVDEQVPDEMMDLLGKLG